MAITHLFGNWTFGTFLFAFGLGVGMSSRSPRWTLFATLFVGIALIPATSFTLRQLKESVFLTGRTTAMVCWLFIGSFTFSAVFAYLGGHEPIEKFVLWMNLSPTGFMILAQFIIFVLGWPLE